MKKTVMVVCAHADDVELQAGGTLAKYIADGYKGYYVQTTRSNSGYHCFVEYGAYDYSEKIADMRKKEVTEAAAVYGAELVLLDFKEHLFTMEDGTQLYADIRSFPEIEGKTVSGRVPIVVACRMEEYIAELAELMCEAEPEVVFVQMPDINPDHYCTLLYACEAFKAASKKADLGALYTRVRLSDNMTLPLKPDFFVDVSAHTAIPEEAIRKHVSQCKCNDRVPSLRRGWQEYADRVAGATYVEAYCKLLPA